MTDVESASVGDVDLERNERLGAMEVSELFGRHPNESYQVIRESIYSAAAPAGFFSSFMFELCPGKMLAEGSR
jgi:hypothetical protein